MKANTSRHDRLNFDADVESYDSARPAVPRAVVEQVKARAQLRSNATVLEIGAATGQLTLPLRRSGFARVVAIEPGDQLRHGPAPALSAVSAPSWSSGSRRTGLPRRRSAR